MEKIVLNGVGGHVKTILDTIERTVRYEIVVLFWQLTQNDEG